MTLTSELATPRPQRGRRRARPAVGSTRFEQRRGGGRWERWSGRRWRTAPYSLRPELLTSPEPLAQGLALGAEARSVLMRKAVSEEAMGGATVVLQADHEAVLGYPRRVNHLGHALVTLLTGGAWLVVWVLATVLARVGHGDHRVRLFVDEHGHVWADEGRG